MGTSTLPTNVVEPTPQFSAHLYCSQTAGYIKMPLGMEIGLSSGDFVLDGDPAPSPKRGGAHPIFGPRLLWPNGWMDQDVTWYGGRPRPTRHCVRCGPSYPQKTGTPTPSNFWPVSIVAKWLDGCRPRPRPHCTRRGPSSRERGTAAPPPIFGLCLLWPRSPISATAELLLRLLSSNGYVILFPVTGK